MDHLTKTQNQDGGCDAAADTTVKCEQTGEVISEQPKSAMLETVQNVSVAMAAVKIELDGEQVACSESADLSNPDLPSTSKGLQLIAISKEKVQSPTTGTRSSLKRRRSEDEMFPEDYFDGHAGIGLPDNEIAELPQQQPQQKDDDAPDGLLNDDDHDLNNYEEGGHNVVERQDCNYILEPLFKKYNFKKSEPVEPLIMKDKPEQTIDVSDIVLGPLFKEYGHRK